MPGALTETAFGIPRAVSMDIGYGRLRGRDLQRPFHGVRANGVDLGRLRERCRALTVVLDAHHAVSHLSGAELLGMPLPRRAAADAPIDVLSLRERDAMRRRGVAGRSTGLDLPTRRVAGVRVVAPADIWCQLAHPRITQITRAWLVAIGDFLVSGERTDFARRPPLCTMDELAEAVARHAGRPGARELRWALERVRMPVDSVRETFLRLALTAAGLPEPVVQLPVVTAKGRRHADLGYPGAGLLLEYLGDAHRTSRRRWLDDLTRVQLFQDAGWDVLMIGAADLEPDPAPLIDRVRRALARRHPSR
jgi:hypothetical protein